LKAGESVNPEPLIADSSFGPILSELLPNNIAAWNLCDFSAVS